MEGEAALCYLSVPHLARIAHAHARVHAVRAYSVNVAGIRALVGVLFLRRVEEVHRAEQEVPARWDCHSVLLLLLLLQLRTRPRHCTSFLSLLLVQVVVVLPVGLLHLGDLRRVRAACLLGWSYVVVAASDRLGWTAAFFKRGGMSGCGGLMLFATPRTPLMPSCCRMRNGLSFDVMMRVGWMVRVMWKMVWGRGGRERCVADVARMHSCVDGTSNEAGIKQKQSMDGQAWLLFLSPPKPEQSKQHFSLSLRFLLGCQLAMKRETLSREQCKCLQCRTL